ncbi:MAG TPA: SigE family RNA polymerase sigma factor [Streptosporangiaceae bacterium]|jgi:RNA polymerase sigma-70 factor (sigma-E family)|nr:SigE family RNA polymerase sigma factor [Streptosporangiaceae bacterium]
MASESLTTGESPAAVQIASLYDAHALGLIRLAYLMLGSQATAEDVVQDAFCGLYRRWPHIADQGKALLYVRSSVINGCRSELRRRKFRPERFHEPAGVSAEDSALANEDRKRAILALSALPNRQRQVLVLRFYLDFSDAQIARALGIGESTVRSTAHRALTALGRTLGRTP